MWDTPSMPTIIDGDDGSALILLSDTVASFGSNIRISIANRVTADNHLQVRLTADASYTIPSPDPYRLIQ